jgi:hypothetical protein
MPASRPERGWSISKSWAVSPTEAAYDAAYIVRLSHDDQSTHELIVEFEAPSAVASVGYAEEIARKYLRTAADPPTHVVVDLGGAVRVMGETRSG